MENRNNHKRAIFSPMNPERRREILTQLGAPVNIEWAAAQRINQLQPELMNSGRAWGEAAVHGTVILGLT